MNDARSFAFGPFRLDSVLRRDECVVDLTPKAYAVLRALLAQAGEVVSREDLWAAVWPGVIVTDAAMSVCITELRKALGDQARSPRYIATVHRRGYRFIAPLVADTAQEGASAPRAPAAMTMANERQLAPASLVGRTLEWDRLQEAFDAACGGQRQLVFVRGEPGIGKSALCQYFSAAVSTAPGVRATSGQCIDHLGTPDAYLPLLDALSRLCRGPDGEDIVRQVARSAPLWLRHLPGLVPDTVVAEHGQGIAHASSERMLLELAYALEALTVERPLILWLEDLQWSDQATLAWLSMMARRPEPACLLVLATCRDAGTPVAEGALARMLDELSLHDQCMVLDLSCLPTAAIETYLAGRLAGSASVGGSAPSGVAAADLHALAATLAERTGGNPLYLTRLVDELCARHVNDSAAGRGAAMVELAVGDGVTRSLKAVLAAQVTGLTPTELALVEAAAIAGQSFSAAVVAAGLGEPASSTESACQALVRRVPWLRGNGVLERPDGTLSSAYSFVHDLYREALAERIPTARAVALHRAIAHAERRAHGPRAAEIASFLAHHFEAGREVPAAAEFCLFAGHNALHRLAHAEAAACYRHGLTLLDGLPAIARAAHRDQALALHLALGPVLIAIRGGASDEVLECYREALSLAAQLAHSDRQFAAAFGLRSVALARAELDAAHAHGTQLLALAESADDDDLRLEAHLALGNTAFQSGRFDTARVHLDTAISRYDERRSSAHVAVYGMDPGMFSLSLAALVHEITGRSSDALAQSARALKVAERSGHAYSLTTAANFAAWLRQLREEPGPTLAFADTAAVLAERHGFAAAGVLARVRRGWALAACGEHAAGIDAIEAGLDTWQALGATLGRPHFLALLADANLRAGNINAGQRAIDEALRAAQDTGERWPQAELLRLAGVLAFAQAHDPAAAAHLFEAAATLAHTQGACLFEQRARQALAQLKRGDALSVGRQVDVAVRPDE